ncbi:unnamed protein product [Rodentolepis nana]|uniref:Integral membrane protein n=1 Tax=Rodentolepis nana TaxID=102285 RepID=A0A158QIE4_RODNA|nr:unnamed protein product [Rodentolepis nana]
MIWPFSWCEWTEWSVCSVEPCYPGRRRTYPAVSRSPKESAMREYCVNSTELPITALRWPETDETYSSVPINPMHMRSRICNCTRKGFSFIGRLLGSCKRNDEVVDCHSCFRANSTVFTHTTGGGALLSCSQLADVRNAEAVASAVASSNRFYAILGGALGAAAFLVLVFCCVRFFLISSSSNSSASRRRAARRAAENTAGEGGTSQGLVDDDDPALRRSRVGLPYSHFWNSELPPAYKDVMGMAVVLPIDPDNPLTVQADESARGCLSPSTMPPLPDSTSHTQSHLPSIPVQPNPMPPEIGGKPDIDGDEYSDEPPPPSYQEVIAFSPSAADMRQRIMAASAETPGAIQQTHSPA